MPARTVRGSWDGMEDAVAIFEKCGVAFPSFPMYVDTASHKTLKIPLRGEICLGMKWGGKGTSGSSPDSQDSFRGS